MHSLEPELLELRAAPRSHAFSIHGELRGTIYLAVLLVAAGIGLLLKHNLARIGPLTLMLGVALAAAACYALPVRSKLRGVPRTMVLDYLLLLGALLLSADLGYAESQFHWFGAHWSRHLLLLAMLHALTAYWLDSRLVLAVALAALTAWIGIEPRLGNLLQPGRRAGDVAVQAMSAAILIQVWSQLHRRLRSTRRFEAVLEHFALNLAFWAALTWCGTDGRRWWGLLLLAVFTALAIARALRTGRELFAAYGLGYVALGLCLIIGGVLQDRLSTAISMLVVLITAAVALFQLRERIRAQP